MEVFVHRIDLGEGGLTITPDLSPLLERTASDPVLAPALPVPMSLRRNGRNRPIVVETNAASPRRDAGLIALVADARRWMDELVRGRARSVAEITEREGLRPGAQHAGVPVRLTSSDSGGEISPENRPQRLSRKTPLITRMQRRNRQSGLEKGAARP